MNSIDRRTALAGLFTTGAFAMAGGALAAGKPFFERVTLPIGLQVYTLGADAGRDLDATFTQVAAIGYREVELPNLYGRKPAEIRAAADKAGLAISSLHLAVTTRGAPTGLSLMSPSAEIAESLRTLGAKQGVLPIAPFPDDFRPQPGDNVQAAIGRAFAQAGPDLWRRTAALLNEKGAMLKSAGIGLGYHNHNIEFAPFPQPSPKAANGWDVLVEETDPALVHFEIDTGWIATAGFDPADFLRRHRGRVTQLHVKDVAPGNTVNFGLSMKPAEIGSGTLDWARILPAAHDAGVRHFYVEQEPPFTIPRIEAARKSYGFLARVHA